MTQTEHPQGTFWTQPLSDLLIRLDVTAGGAGPAGLGGAEAASRLVRFGPNVLRPARPQVLVFQFLSHFRSPLVIILLFASAISALTGDVTSFTIITVIVLLSVTLDFVQEYRAGRAAERLQRSVAVRVSVLRDGQPQDIPVDQVVPGDVVLLSAGDLVPADGRVLEARDFFVNQALLTGESYPVEKHPSDIPAGTDLAGAGNAVFMGTSVISGSAGVLVCRTGAATALGEIADTLAARNPPTAFERGTRSFGLLIMRLTFLLVLFVVLVNGLFHRPLLESFLFAVALAVGLTPELLPMVVSVTLARGALRMAGKKVIVRRLAAIQDLGSMDVLCTDKTGTLTEARIRLERHVDGLGRDSRSVLELAYLNSVFETGLKSPLDHAILEHSEIDVHDWRRVDEVPFDFERRRISVLVGGRAEERLLVVKGAPEDILRLCTRYAADGSQDFQPLEEPALERMRSLFDALSREGLRVLGVAWREMPPGRAQLLAGDEADLIFAGFAAFLDPPKASAAAALQRLAAGGVRVKIVTGDNELVTQHMGCGKAAAPLPTS